MAQLSNKETKELTGMTKKELMAIRKQYMTKEELNYLKRKELVEKVWPIFRFFIMFGLCFVILYPIIYMVTTAFRPQADMNDPTVMWISKSFTLTNIRDAARAMNYGETVTNTLVLNIGCSLLQAVTCAITGYGFARFKFKFKSLLFAIVILMILVPPQIILIPQYILFRYFDIFGLINLITGNTISLINSPLTMYLPALTANGIRAGLFIFIYRQFFRGLPKELEDAAYLDGCGPFRTFVQIMVPNASSSFLTVFLLSVVWYWNDYYVSVSFFTDNQTIALMVANLQDNLTRIIFDNGNVSVNVRELIVWMEAGCLIAILPMLIMYVILQKNFTEGIERSGLVG